jgi:hypothetical protein
MVLLEKAESGTLPPASFAADVAMDTAKEEIGRGVVYDSRYTLNSNDAYQQVVRMAKSYHAEVAPGINAIMIEQQLDAKIPWSTEGIIISGRPDVVAREPGAIDDLKAGTRTGYHLPQFGSYSMIVRSNNIIDVEKGRVTWVPRASMKKPQPSPVTLEIDIGQAERIATNVLKHIDMAIHVWRHGDEERGLPPGAPEAFISNPASMLCGEKWCSAHSCGSRGWCTDAPSNKGDE